MAILLIASDVLLAADSAERFRSVQLALRNNELETALLEVTQLREDFPADVDYALACAQVLERLGRDDDALAELAVASRLAPDYEDVWRLRLVILSRHPDRPEYASVAEEAAKRFPMAAWRLPPQNETFWVLSAGTAYEKLSNGLPSWNNQFIGLSREKPRHYRLAAELARDARFNAADYSVRLSAQRSLSHRAVAGLAVAFAGNPQFQPDQEFGGHISALIGGGWKTTLAFRRRDYTTTSVTSLIGTIEKYYGSFRFAYSLTGSRLRRASTSLGHTFTANWYVNEAASIGVTLGGGEEAEAIGDGAILKSDVNAVSLSGRYHLGRRYTLQGWVGTHKQGDFYRRRFLGLAVSIRI
jgi:YaiO family outer membrane protein